MNSIKIFENKEFGEIRTVDVNGKFYAVGIVWHGHWSMPTPARRYQTIAEVTS